MPDAHAIPSAAARSAAKLLNRYIQLFPTTTATVVPQFDPEEASKDHGKHRPETSCTTTSPQWAPLTRQPQATHQWFWRDCGGHSLQYSLQYSMCEAFRLTP